MAYNKEQIYNEALELSKKMGFFFVQDLIDYLRIAKSTFYSFFPDDSNELDTLKENLYKNRINEKVKLRHDWHSGNPAEKMALYKLICTPEERQALSMTYIDNKHSGEIKTKTTILVQSAEDAERLKNAIDNIE